MSIVLSTGIETTRDIIVYIDSKSDTRELRNWSFPFPNVFGKFVYKRYRNSINI